MTAVEDLDLWQKKIVGLTESAELVSLEKNAQYAIAVAANTSAVSPYFCFLICLVDQLFVIYKPS